MIAWILAAFLAAAVVFTAWRSFARGGKRRPTPERASRTTTESPIPAPLPSSAIGTNRPAAVGSPAGGVRLRPRHRSRAAFPARDVQFEYTILSLNGEPIEDPEFNHRLLVKEGASGRITPAVKSLLERDALKLECVQRRFLDGRAHKDAPIFDACRRVANRAQLMVGLRERDVLAMCRGAFRLRYAGPPAPDGAHLDLMALASDAVLSLRPGILVDHAGSVIWPAAAWKSRPAGGEAFDPRDHLKMEMAEGRSGMKLGSRGMGKFGFPELAIEGLPHDMAAEAAAAMTSIALELIRVEQSVEPGMKITVPRANGVIGFDSRPADPEAELPLGAWLLLGSVDGDAPTQLGLLEVLARLRKTEDSASDDIPRERADEIYRRAQAALPRLKRKYQAGEQRPGRLFLVRRQSDRRPPTAREAWLLIQSWNGPTLETLPVTAGEESEESAAARQVAFEEDDILDWMIMNGGDVEDGAFALRLASADQDAPKE